MNAELIRAADRWQRIWMGPINGTSGNEATVSRDDVDAARVMANHILESASDFGEDGEPLEVTAEFCESFRMEFTDIRRWRRHISGVCVEWSEFYQEIYVNGCIRWQNATRPQLRLLVTTLTDHPHETMESILAARQAKEIQ